jgi:hypothetical protein
MSADCTKYGQLIHKLHLKDSPGGRFSFHSKRVHTPSEQSFDSNLSAQLYKKDSISSGAVGLFLEDV